MADKVLVMTPEILVAEVVFCAGWIGIGVAAALSRYKKAVELGDKASGRRQTGEERREYHRGMFFGREMLIAPESGPAAQADHVSAAPARTAVPSQSDPAIPVAPAALESSPASLARLAQVLEEAAKQAKPKEEKAPIG